MHNVCYSRKYSLYCRKYTETGFYFLSQNLLSKLLIVETTSKCRSDAWSCVYVYIGGGDGGRGGGVTYGGLHMGDLYVGVH